MLDSKPVVMSADAEQPDLISEIYDETQQWIMENYPDSYAAQTYIAAAEELINGTDAQSGENGYYTYIYNPPAGYAWQVVALVGEEIAGGTEIPDVPSVPEPKYYSAAWTAPAQSASGSFDLTFTVNTDKVQLNTLEKVDGAVITVTPSRTSGSVDGGSWQMIPAAAQTITTSGHTQDDSFHVNGGDGSATWTVHYEVSKTSTSTLSGQEGPFTSQAEADAAAEAAKNAAIGKLQNEAQGMVDAAIAAARAQLANITFAYDEITIPHGFDSTPGALGSHQTITVPANSFNDYKCRTMSGRSRSALIKSTAKQSSAFRAMPSLKFLSGMWFGSAIFRLAGTIGTKLSARVTAPIKSSTTATMQAVRTICSTPSATRVNSSLWRAARQRVLRRLDGCDQTRRGRLCSR